MDEECQEEDDEDEDCDELPVVDPLDMHDAGCSGHHILTAPNAPVCSSADQCRVQCLGSSRSRCLCAWSLAQSFSRDNFPSGE